MKKRLWLLPTTILLLAAIAFFVYTSDYYHAADAGLKALESDDVMVEETDFGWYFDGPASDTALIFYPGAKVDEAAYAPLLHRLAKSRMDVCLVKMPFHLAFFGMNKADRILERYDYAHWYIGGHSLGGVMAADFAASHDLQGLILLASYPTKAVDEPILLIYGTEDGVLNMGRVEDASRFGAVNTVAIEGGNHASFGSYGEQAGDNASKISAEEQQEKTIAAIAAWLP